MSTLLKALADATPYRRMLAKLLPRGPIWDLVSQPGLLALVDGLAAELKRIHNRLVDARAEADPRTTDELLDEWLTAWDVDGTTNADLVAKVTATGGQSRAYFIRVVRAILGDDTADVTITERPYGRTFRAWSGLAWDPVNGTPAEFYWRVTVPYGTDADTVDIIEAALERTKPAHTIVEVEVAEPEPLYYLSSPGGAGVYAEASTNAAARTIFPGTAPTFTIVAWFRNASTLFGAGDVVDAQPSLYAYSDGSFAVDLANDAGAFVSQYTGSFGVDTWDQCVTVGNGSTIESYFNAVSSGAPSALTGAYAASDTFVALAYVLSGAGSSPGEMRALAIFDRALSAAEIAALQAAGETHDLLTTTGAYATADPPFLWDGPDEGGYIANRGSGGVCNLILHGITAVAL